MPPAHPFAAAHILVIASFLILSPFTLAQSTQPPTPPPAQQQTPRPPRYNTATETTVNGVIDSVQQVQGRHHWTGTHLQLKTTDTATTYDVHLGPAWFLTRNHLTLTTGDHVQITGSKVSFNNTDTILARTIKKGEAELTLRNPQGFPLWSRRNRNPMP